MISHLVAHLYGGVHSIELTGNSPDEASPWGLAQPLESIGQVLSTVAPICQPFLIYHSPLRLSLGSVHSSESLHSSRGEWSDTGEMGVVRGEGSHSGESGVIWGRVESFNVTIFNT